jgi:hypothetical protein
MAHTSLSDHCHTTNFSADFGSPGEYGHDFAGGAFSRAEARIHR